MDVIFSLLDLKLFLAIKLVFFVYIIFLAIYFFKLKNKNLALFIIITYLLSALSYLLLVKGLKLPFWGLKGDEITIAAMFNSFAHKSLFSDFAYSNLPAFYPALFFQFFGLFGKIFNLNGVQIMKLAAATGIASFSFVFYYIQKYYWQNKSDICNNKYIWFLSALLLPVIIGWNEMIMKSYELFGSSLIILWSVFLINDLLDKKLDTKKYILYGLTGGVLFLIFYFWFFLAAIGISIFFLINRESPGISKYLKLLMVAVLVILFGSPFWLPLSNSYKVLGSENWQLGFFVLDWIKVYAPMFKLNFSGLILSIGLFSLIYFRKNRIIQLYISLFIAGYIWQLMGISSLILFDSPLQESKGQHFFSQVILVLAAGFGLSQIWVFLINKYKFNINQKTSILFFISLLFSVNLFFGTFSDKPEVQEARVRGRSFRPGISELITYLEQNNINKHLIQTSGIPELYAFLDINNYLYFNQHNSHPAALFSKRYEYLYDLSRSKTSVELNKKLETSEIKYFVFYKGVDNYYPMYFHLDAFPYKIEETKILLDKKLFIEPQFSKEYENGHFIVIKPNYGN